MKQKLATGCIHCHEGSKMVLFVTGICPRSCWYCPLSAQRKGVDKIYANEKLIYSPDEAIIEAEKMEATGTGITGGEPLLFPERVLAYGGRLKEVFGEGHHIHLYTSCAPDEAELRKIAGFVDELRMHPPVETWKGIGETRYRTSALRAREMGFEVGFEVPALPEVADLLPALEFLDFLNINELEWGESNAQEMRRKELVPEDSVHNAVRGSRAWAAPIGRSEKVHFCSSEFKDSVQLRKRLIRTARNTARPFEEITEDGTVVYGRMALFERIPEWIRALGHDMFEICDGRVETAYWVLIEHRDIIGEDAEIIERYPDGGVIVEVTPL
jgi:pyruvate formate-lyase activating enzyme-like uncharacterized protein